mgnify:CR=1 FL=1
MNLKQTWSSFTSSISGILGFLGGYQVCHNACLGIIFLLSLMGITVVGMPLLFLTKVAVPFWIAAFVLLVITIGISLRKKCISHKLIMFNAGMVVAGVPFQQVREFSVFFWAIGGSLAIGSIVWVIADKAKMRKMKK